MVFGRGDESTIRGYVQSKGAPFAMLCAFLQSALVLITIFPGELFQIFVGVAYGLGWGVLICWVGVVTGSMLVFFIARHAKNSYINKRTKEQQAQLTEKFTKSNRHHIVLIILMYAFPGFTYGLVTLIIATCTKVKWWSYLLIASAGSLFFITFTVLFGNLMVTANPLITIGVTGCIIFLMLIFLLNKNRIIQLIFSQKKTLDEKLNIFKVKKPSVLPYLFLLPVLKGRFVTKKNVHFNYLYDVKSLKPPYVVLSSHPSRMDYAYVVSSILPYKMNIIINRWFFHNRILNVLLTQIGGIPKKLFTAEFNVMKNIMNVIKNKGILNIFPEGINTIYGASNPVIPATAGLLKKLKVPVVSIGINGAFLSIPKWNYEADYVGKIDLNIDLLFTPEQIEQKSEEEILSELNEKLAYNDYKWVRENNIVYKAENRTKGLNHLLYLCPGCQSQFKLTTQENNIWCTECGNGAFLDNQFQLNKIKDTDVLPLDIAEWYKLQEQNLSKEIACEEFELREKCTVITFNKSGFKLYPKYRGEVTVNKQGLRFIGKEIKTGKEKEILCEKSTLPRVSNTLNKSFDFYLINDYYEFDIEEGIKAVKWTMAINEIVKNFEKEG
ncbi:MAG: VTT domain-containing protein [Treponema sp.]|jgi:uncharacterized membrane protein YdjX (TVP38/TMEM64 family)|nr:VTT domain-containing protein [Treponema sp.]